MIILNKYAKDVSRHSPYSSTYNSRLATSLVKLWKTRTNKYKQTFVVDVHWWIHIFQNDYLVSYLPRVKNWFSLH